MTNQSEVTQHRVYDFINIVIQHIRSWVKASRSTNVDYVQGPHRSRQIGRGGVGSPLERQKRRANLLARRFLQYIGLPVALLLMWQIAVSNGIINPLLLPTPSSIGTSLWRMIIDGQLVSNLRPDVFRLGLGYAFGWSGGLIIGAVIGLSALVKRFADSTLQLLRPIPPITLIPVALLWFGIGSASKIAIVAFSAFWPVFLNTELGVREIPELQKEAARILELTRRQYYTKIVLRGSLGKVITGLRLGAATGLIGLVAAEMVESSNGLGYLIVSDERNFDAPAMFAVIVVVSIIGLILNGILQMVWKRFD